MSEESRSEPDENSGKSSSDEEETINEYEKQRLERIKENKARLEALRLPSLASALLSSGKNKRKGKEKKGEEDIEYIPSEAEEMKISSSEEEEEEGEKSGEEEDDDEFEEGRSGSPYSSRGSSRKGKQSLNKSKSKKKCPVQKHVRQFDFIDDDEALQQAIALSLQDSSEISGAVLREPSQNCGRVSIDVEPKKRKGKSLVQDIDKRKLNRKTNTSRVQITEDQVIIHFFQFDEAGKGGISVKDLRRVVADHDFTWTDEEMADMIHLFDNNGDGRLSLEDFRKILHQCKMIKM